MDLPLIIFDWNLCAACLLHLKPIGPLKFFVLLLKIKNLILEIFNVGPGFFWRFPRFSGFGPRLILHLILFFLFLHKIIVFLFPSQYLLFQDVILICNLSQFLHQDIYSPLVFSIGFSRSWDIRFLHWYHNWWYFFTYLFNLLFFLFLFQRFLFGLFILLCLLYFLLLKSKFIVFLHSVDARTDHLDSLTKVLIIDFIFLIC